MSPEKDGKTVDLCIKQYGREVVGEEEAVKPLPVHVGQVDDLEEQQDEDGIRRRRRQVEGASAPLVTAGDEDEREEPSDAQADQRHGALEPVQVPQVRVPSSAKCMTE